MKRSDAKKVVLGFEQKKPSCITLDEVLSMKRVSKTKKGYVIYHLVKGNKIFMAWIKKRQIQVQILDVS